MAPEPSLLKRKRSRPSEWWAVAPVSSPTQQPQPSSQRDESTAKRHTKVRKSELSAPELLPASQLEVGSSGENVVKKKRGRPSLEALRREKDTFDGPVTSRTSDTAHDDSHGKSGPLRRKVPNSGRADDEADDLGDGRAINIVSSGSRHKRAREATLPNEKTADGEDTSQRTAGQKSRKDKPLLIGEDVVEVTKPDSGKSLRRGRSSHTEAEVQAIFEQAVYNKKPGDTTVRKHGGKNEDKGISQRRGRSSNAEAELQTIIPKPSSSQHKVRKKDDQARKRRSGSVLEVVTATSNFGRGRPKKNGAQPARVVQSETSRANRHTPKPAKTSPPTKSLKNAKASSKTAARPQKRRSIEVVAGKQSRNRKDHHAEEAEADTTLDEEDVEDEESDAPAYQHLVAVTRNVSRQTIDSKWEALPPGCIERVSQLLQDIQKPVIVHLNDENKRVQASTALHMVSRKLVNKISKGLPFPQGTRNHREDDFDFEKILDHNRGLEASLTHALHANALLEAEVAKESALLDADQELLTELESNAKKEASSRKQIGRKIHPLLRSEPSSLEDDAFDLHGLGHGHSPAPSIVFHQDESLQDVIKALGGHMDSIQGNIGQVQGISEAVAQSKAAVQSTLFNHLPSGQYEDVVLG